MFCSKCGKQIEKQKAQFCPYCGNPLSLLKPEKEKPKGMGYPKGDKMRSGKEGMNVGRKRKRAAGRLLLLALVVVAVFLIVYFIFLKSGQTEKIQDSEEEWQPLTEMNREEPSGSGDVAVRTDISDFEEEETESDEAADMSGTAAEETDLSDIHSYSVEKVKCTWTEAKALAEEKGGYLAIINSEEENDYIKTLLQLEGVKMYWIGGNDLENGVYTWIDDTPIQYSDWHDGEPNGDQGIEHYMSIYQIGGIWKWNDLPDDVGEYYEDSLGMIIEYENIQ